MYCPVRKLGNGEIPLLEILQSYDTTPSNTILFTVDVLLKQKKMCTVNCQLEFSIGNAGNNNSKVVT